ncbi:MAG: glycosyltransferase [Limisphaerales bacterium]
MRILITNNTLQHRSGSELYARDVACRLRELGHEVVAFSTQIGAVADDMVAGGVVVVDNLSRLPFQPDIIHGQHHLETMTALLYLPGVPAVYFCHGALPWEEMPPVFPRIRCYAAVDFACRERVVRDAGVPEAAVRILPNFVNLQRFGMRPPLPEKPQRALIFSNGATGDNYAKEIRVVCANVGVAVDTIGLLVQSSAGAPGRIVAAI